MQKYISPGSWFSLEYPEGWHEFEDTEESFLFYNPDCWNGNFRISAFQGKGDTYAETCLKEELQQISGAKRIQVGKYACVFSSESFQDKDTWFTSYFWLIGCKSICLECSFTVKRGESVKIGEAIINTIRVYHENERRLREIIPVRVLETERINESYDWAVSTLKRKLTKDFTASENDIASIQKLLETGGFNASQRQPWECFGIAFASILINEIDGMDWVTVIDGTHEYPALRFRETEVMFNPTQFIYEKIKKGLPCDLQQEYTRIKAEVEAVL